MYFDPQLKTSKKDLFMRDKELKELSNLDVPLTLVLGPRRLGKTSLLKVFIHETNIPFIFTDCRSLVITGTSVNNYHQLMINQLNNLAKKRNSVINFLKKVKGLNLFGVELELDSTKKDSFLVETFNALNDWALENKKKLYLIYDEAQLLRNFKRKGGLDFNKLFSYIYDNLQGLRIILTGSEVGILEEFIGLESSSSPLYGRYVKKLYLSRFKKEESEEFLKIGFKQVGTNVSKRAISEVVDVLDGIVGWLVYFGRTCMETGEVNRKSINITLEKAEKIVNDELSNLSRNSKRYISVLKAVAFGSKNWKEIKTATEIIERNYLTDTSFNRILNKLIELSYIDYEIFEEKKKYSIIDPVLNNIVKKQK